MFEGFSKRGNAIALGGLMGIVALSTLGGAYLAKYLAGDYSNDPLCRANGTKPAFKRSKAASVDRVSGMPRYFFNVHRNNPSPDMVGLELPDNKAAWREATLFAGELFKDVEAGFEPGQDWFLEVTDKCRNPIFFIRVSGEEV